MLPAKGFCAYRLFFLIRCCLDPSQMCSKPFFIVCMHMGNISSWYMDYYQHPGNNSSIFPGNSELKRYRYQRHSVYTSILLWVRRGHFSNYWRTFITRFITFVMFLCCRVRFTIRLPKYQRSSINSKLKKKS